MPKHLSLSQWQQRRTSVVSGPIKIASNRRCTGFTLVEVLVSLVVLTVASAGAVVAFNVTTQAVRGTESRSEQNRLIDDDIARVNRISETFTSCVEPAGANPSDPATYCTGDEVSGDPPNSFYYFPEISDPADPDTWTDATDFRSACSDGSLRASFIAALGGGAAANLNGADGSVLAVRQPVVGAANSSHLVVITWTDPGDSSRVLRRLLIAPIVSSWCP